MTTSPYEHHATDDDDATPPGGYEDSWRLDDPGLDEDDEDEDIPVWTQGGDESIL